MGVTVSAADGRVWTVERRLRFPSWRQIDRDPWDVLVLADASLLGAAVGLGLALVLGALIVVLLPLLLLIAELLLLLVALVVFRAKWIVEATTMGPPVEKKAWEVRGPRRSKRAVDEVASALRAGAEPVDKMRAFLNRV